MPATGRRQQEGRWCRYEDRESRRFAGPSGQIFFSKSTQKRRSHAAGALQAWAGRPSSPPWSLISWFLHVNFCRPISAVPEQPQRRPGAACDLPHRAILGLGSLLSLLVLGSRLIQRLSTIVSGERGSGVRASKDSLDSWDGELGLLGSAPLLSFSWSPPAASVTKGGRSYGNRGRGGGTLRQHACRSKRLAEA